MDSRKFTEASKRRLGELLDAKSEQGNTMRCDEVQGFMTALLSGPDKLAPLDWLPEVLGDESQFTAAERSEIERLVLAMAMETTAAMSDKKLPDLWLYDDGEGGSDFYTWCNAYLYGLDIVPTDWFEAADDEAFEELFYPVMALGGIYDEEENGAIRLQFTEGEPGGTCVRTALRAGRHLPLLAGGHQQTANRPQGRGKNRQERSLSVRQRQEIQGVLR